MSRLRVLFLCTANACRSQMAEGFARALQGDIIEPYSAGTEPAALSRRAVRVMAEAGVDLSGQRAKSVAELLDAGLTFDYVVTLCDNARGSCPIFPGKARVVHVPFDDPDRLAAEAGGGPEAELAAFRRVRDEIRAFVERLPENLAQSSKRPVA